MTDKELFAGENTIRLPYDIGERFQNLAQATGQSRADHILEALLSYLEDREDIRNADETMRLIKAGKMPVLSEEELERFLELEPPCPAASA